MKITAIQLPAHNLGITIIPAHITDWQKASINTDIHLPSIGMQCRFATVQC